MNYEEIIRAIIAKSITSTEDICAFGISSNLQEAGMDSLTFINVIIEIEEHFQVEIPDDKLLITEAGTIKQLCEIVEKIKGS